jgi:hypothetical protein
VIRRSTESLAFKNYLTWMDTLSVDEEAFRAAFARFGRKSATRPVLPFPDIESYELLDLATEAFLFARAAVYADVAGRRRPLESGAHEGGRVEALPFLALVRRHEPSLVSGLTATAEKQVTRTEQLVAERFRSPCLLELIWSYWHEEGMLVRTVDAVSLRSHESAGGPHDALASMSIEPLRPLGDRLASYVASEGRRLTRARRELEYDPEYGLALSGRREPPSRSDDRRAPLDEVLDRLLERTAIFLEQDDDVTIVADALPMLNALRGVHLFLREHAARRCGDLPWTARREMLIQQWLLARAEVRDFLPTREATGDPERWIDSVEAMNHLQGWTDVPVRQFHELAVLGEQLLLSIRIGEWGEEAGDREQAANWARYWREELERYLHAHRIVTRRRVAAGAPARY